MTKEEKITSHRSRRPKMVQLAKEFAAELDQVCRKYSILLEKDYFFYIKDEDYKDPSFGLTFNECNRLLLLDGYYPNDNNGFINLNASEV